MAEYWAERVAATLKTTLEGIVGDDGTTYWYTPDVVERTHEWRSRQILNDKYQTIYILSPFEIEVEEQAGQQHEEFALIDFALLRRYQLDDEVYRAQTPTRWTEQTRLWGDFKKKILSDPTLGGLVTNIQFRSVSFDAEDTYYEGWQGVIGQIAPYQSLQGDSPE